MGDVSWIKMSTDIFNNYKIKQIESLPDGDAIVVIWVKILCLAGRINDDGFVYFTKEIPYTEQMLATQFNRPLALVQMALNIFQQFKMIEVVDDILHISNWEKYQNTQALEKIKEQTRKRVEKYRKNKALEKCNVTCNVTCNADVTQCNAIERDKEEDIDISKDISKRESITKSTLDRVMYLYNTRCFSLPSIKSITDKRKATIKAMLKKYSLEDIEELFKLAEASAFLRGDNDRGWVANFDWIMKESNAVKIFEGNYDDKGFREHRAKEKQHSINEFPQKDMSDKIDQIEKMMLQRANRT